VTAPVVPTAAAGAIGTFSALEVVPLAVTDTVAVDPGVTDHWLLPPEGDGTVKVIAVLVQLSKVNEAASGGAPIDIYTCNSTNAQNWTVGSGNTLQVLGKCMDVTGGATADGTPVQLYDCNGTGAQVWEPQGDGALLNPQSGRCLDDPGSGGSGTDLDIYDCSGGGNQTWVLP